MKTSHLLACFLAGALPITTLAQGSPTASPAATKTAEHTPSAPSPAAPDAAELTQLLKEFLAGASHDDVAVHERFWAEDLIYTGSSGRRINKPDIMRSVREEAAPKKENAEASAPAETTIYSAEDIRIQQYGTTAIVAFRLVGTTVKGDKTEVSKYFNTGTFLKRDGKWQAVAWQATKIPENEEPKG